MMVLIDVQDLMSGTHDTLHEKGAFADVLRLRILRWEEYPVLSRWPLNIITNFVRGGEKTWLQTEENKAMQWKKRKAVR
jgi:hypothetical protein